MAGMVCASGSPTGFQPWFLTSWTNTSKSGVNLDQKGQ